MESLTDGSGHSAASSSLAEDARGLLAEAMAMHREGRLSAADALYARTLQLEPANAQALRLRGVLAREQNDLESSLSWLQQAAEIAPHDPGPHSELALSRMAAGDWQLAEASFREALACDPECLRALANLGALLQRRGHLWEAIDLHRRYLELEPADPEVRCNLSFALMDAGRGDEALEECDGALAAMPDHPLLLANLGAILCGLEQFERAAEVLDKSVVINPENELAWINLGYARTELGDVAAAASAVRNCLEGNPANARAAADLAGILLAESRVDEAIETCSQFLARHPGERLVIATYAIALRAAGRVDEAGAIVDFDELVKVREPDTPTGYASLAEFNAAIADFVQSHPSIVNSPVSKATAAGGQTGEINFDDLPELAALHRLIGAAVNEFAAELVDAGFSDHPAMAYATDNWWLRAWGVVLRDSGRQTPHLHPLAWMSGVYYVSLPADMGTPGLRAGWLEFGMPPERLRVPFKPETHLIEPQAGQIVLFPSYLYHLTRPFTSAEPRISIAFDVVPK